MTHADDAALRSDLFRMIRGKVPEQDAEDIVQATLIEALSSPTAPQEGEARRKWAFGVAKNKIADYYRRSRRETFEVPEITAPPASVEERDMLRWAAESLPEGGDAPKTLEWMLREGDGEKLEAIAASEKLPAPRVRQRVSRLRRHLKQHWAKEVAVLAALGLLAIAAFFLLRRNKDDVALPQPDPSAHAPTPLEVAKKTRRDALERCKAAAWDECERGLDAAQAVDPAGESDPEVRSARDALRAVRNPPPAPSATPSATPIDTAPVPTTPPPVPKSKPSPPSSGFAPQSTSPGPTVFPPSKIGPKPMGKKAASVPTESFEPNAPGTKLDVKDTLEKSSKGSVTK